MLLWSSPVRKLVITNSEARSHLARRRMTLVKWSRKEFHAFMYQPNLVSIANTCLPKFIKLTFCVILLRKINNKIKIIVVAINTIALHSCYIKLHCQLTSSLHNKRTSMSQIVCGVPMIIRIIRIIVPSTITLHPYKRAKKVLRSSQYGCLKGHICDKKHDNRLASSNYGCPKGHAM